MMSLVTVYVTQYGLGALASVLLLTCIIGVGLFLIRAVRVERERQKPTPEQLALPIEKWVNVWSPRRRSRLLSQLPAPSEDGVPGERFIRVSGQSRAALVAPLLLPLAVLIMGGLLMYLAHVLGALANRLPPPSKHQKPAPEVGLTISLSGSTLKELLVGLFIVLFVVACLWAGYQVAKWGGTYFVLSDFRFRRIWIYPVWMFWVNIDPQEIELHMMTTKGSDLNLIGKTFGGFGELQLDTAGQRDDEFFNHIPWVPSVTEFAIEIANAQREAAPVAVANVHADRNHDVLVEIRDLLARGGTVAASQGTPDDTVEQPVVSDDTSEIPPFTGG